MNDVRLTPHFSLREFIRSEKARKRGILNQPTAVHLENLRVLAWALEEVRSLLHSPILIASGYRCAQLNEAIGGVPSSAHTRGLAADFISPDFGDVLEICQMIDSSDLIFDQLVYEQRRRGTTHKTWVHFSMDIKMRRQVLSWNPSVGYVKGIKSL